MKISIVMTTYNGANFLSEQLQSFIDQTRLPDELVICDDGSTDATMDIILEFAQKAPFDVHYFQNESNLGYTKNFNRAISFATGDLVFLSDQDDVWFPEKISYIETLAEKDLYSFVFINDAIITDITLNEVGFTILDQFDSAGIDYSEFVTGCCSAIRRELLEFCLPIPDGFNGHDKWISLFADGLGRKRIVRRSLQYYRRYDNNTSTFIVNSTKKARRDTLLARKIKSLFSGNLAYQFVQSLEQQKLFLSGIDHAIKKTSGNLQNELLELRKITTQQIQVAEVRLGIQRERFILNRLRLVLRFWMKGGYRSMSPIKNMIRDILA